MPALKFTFNKIQRLFQTVPFQTLVLFVAICTLGVLLWRNPFSNRTLIPNFEPFPDALYYVQPPHCLLQGKGWEMCRTWETNIVPITPAGYSITLLPFFAFFNDTRMFYFANVALAFCTLISLWTVLKKITSSWVIQGLVLLLYVTNYYVYWLPTVAMAENLAILVCAVALVLLTYRQSAKQVAGIVVVALALYGTKYALIPTTGVFMLAAFWQLIQILKTRFPRTNENTSVLFGSLVALVLLGAATWLNFHYVQWVLGSNFFKFQLESTQNVWFSLAFLPEYLPRYASALLVGTSQPFLWSLKPAFPYFLGALGATGWIVGAIWQPKERLLYLSIIGASVLQLLFIATFYALDVRYIWHLFPAVLVGVAALIQGVESLQFIQSRKHIFTAVLIATGALILVFSFPRLKAQASLNIKYAESPWWYLSVLEISTYFQTNQLTEQPIVIAGINPFLVDYFSKGTFAVLPLSEQQDFHQYIPELWRISKADTLLQAYKRVLESGQPLYVTNYGTAGAGYLQENFALLSEEFTLTQVHSGCYNLCNLYKLTSKDSDTESLIQ